MRERVNILKNMQHKLNKVFFKNFCFVSESCQCICFALLLTRTNNCQNIKISNNFYAKSWKKQQKLWIMSNYLLNTDWVTVTACQFQFDIYCLCICCSFCVPFQKHYCYLFTVSLLLWSWVNTQKNLIEKKGCMGGFYTNNKLYTNNLYKQSVIIYPAF